MRLLRGTGVGAAAVGVSLAGHVAGQDTMPSATTLVGVLAASAAIAWVLSLARWTLVSLTGVLVAVQSVLHLLFSAGSGAGATGHLTWPMLLGHLVATVVMVGALRRGEELLWSVVESLGLRVWRTLRGIAGLPRPTVPIASVARSAVPRCWQGSEPPRRGPPLGSRSLSVPA